MTDSKPPAAPKFFGDNPEDNTKDAGKELMKLLCNELIRRLTDSPGDLVASELEVVRKLLTDNSVTLANVRRGDFGQFAQKAAEEFPFDDEGNVTPIKKKITNG